MIMGLADRDLEVGPGSLSPLGHERVGRMRAEAANTGVRRKHIGIVFQTRVRTPGCPLERLTCMGAKLSARDDDLSHVFYVVLVNPCLRDNSTVHCVRRALFTACSRTLPWILQRSK